MIVILTVEYVPMSRNFFVLREIDEQITLKRSVVTD